MKVSVIVPAYNREFHIGPALQSLMRQRDDAELDIIVVDDGSTDRTAEAVENLMAGAPCIRLFRQPNLGVAAARNAGLRQIPPDAELVTFLDSDDISVAGRFAAEVPLFRADPDLALSYSRMTVCDDLDDLTFAPTPTDTDYLFRVFEQRPNFRFLDTVGVGYRQHSA
jgi:glycosyltransferase involved in cell wall biosynthesis